MQNKHDESMRMDLQALDELSDDGTPQQLAALGIRTLQPAERRGVTHNWNMVRLHRTCSLGGLSEVTWIIGVPLLGLLPPSLRALLPAQRRDSPVMPCCTQNSAVAKHVTVNQASRPTRERATALLLFCTEWSPPSHSV